MNLIAKNLPQMLASFMLALAVFLAVPGIKAVASDSETFLTESDSPQTYLMENPLHLNTQLNLLEKGIHWTNLAGWIFGPPVAVFLTTNNLATAGSVFLWELLTTPPQAPLFSLGHLKIKEAFKKAQFFNQLKNIKGIRSVKVVVGGPIKMSGPLIISKLSRGFVFVRGSKDLDIEKLGELGLGKAVPLGNLNRYKIHLRLSIGHSEHEKSWELSLKDFFAEKKIPQETLKAWLEEVAAYSKKQNLRTRYVTNTHWNNVKIVAYEDVGGEFKSLGSVLQSVDVKKFLGLDNLSKSYRTIQGLILSKQPAPKPRAIKVTSKKFHSGCEIPFLRMSTM